MTRGEYGTLKAVNSSANPSMASTCRSPQPGRPNPCRAELLARGAGSSIDLAISSSFQLWSSVVLPSSRWPTLRNPLATVDKQLQLHHPRTHAPKVCRHAPFTALPVRSWRSFTPATRAPCGFCRAQLTSLSGCQVLLRRPTPSSSTLSPTGLRPPVGVSPAGSRVVPERWAGARDRSRRQLLAWWRRRCWCMQASCPPAMPPPL